MIKLENTAVMNMDNAIRGMRNPLNSWDKSDSKLVQCHNQDKCGSCPGDAEPLICEMMKKSGFVIVGENDLALMHKLAASGSDHRKFLRQIMVSVDITAPLYWWKEFDTYKVGTVANSCSTMHTIHKRDLTLDDFSHEQLIDEAVKHLETTIEMLNQCREVFLNWDDIPIAKLDPQVQSKKHVWYHMIQLLPSSYNQKRTVTLNYEVLLKQYHARKNHKLDEWHTYCDWIKSLPYFEEICL
jgi:hypothetical protein